MRLLIIGGSEFLGRAFAAEALAAGHTVTTFNRGKSAPDVPGVKAVRGDRTSEEDIARLVEGRDWDAVVDTCGYVPSVVGLSVRALADKAESYLFISSISAVAGWPSGPVDDSSPTYECSPDAGPDDGDYGTLKAGCERVVERDFPGRALVFRAGLIIGPHENVGRLPSWLIRLAGAEKTLERRVLAPGDPERPMRLIDARDIALFGLRCLAGGVSGGASGAYLVTAPTPNTTYGEWLGDCVAATGSSAELVWADDDFLIDQGVRFWTEMPLWAPADHPEIGHVWDAEPVRAVEAGLRCRPVRETVFDTWAWLSADGGRALQSYAARDPHGLAVERERAVLTAWDARG